jgi:hypothetical protein
MRPRPLRSDVLFSDHPLPLFGEEALVKKSMPIVQHRVAPRPKQCPLCKKSVTKADFDGKKAKYGRVTRRSELGLRWQHLACISLDVRRKGLAAGGRSRSSS